MSKKYLIVGASSGIGLELAKKLLENGHELVAISRTQGDLPREVTFLTCDVCSWDSHLPEISETFDGLVYLPGTINLKPFSQLKLEEFRKDLEINYLGAVRVIQHYLKNLQGKPNSSIVLMSSVAARTGIPFHASIGSAKAAVEGLAIALAAELSPKVRVNLVAPSLTETPLSQDLLNTDVKREHAIKRHPLQSIGATKDMASAIAYLLSEDSRWITGQVLHVDGGLSTLRLLT